MTTKHRYGGTEGVEIKAVEAKRKSYNDLFGTFAQTTSHIAGRPIAFLLATLTVIAWGLTGPLFHYSDTWQLVINTGTTIITFLMVFLIQSSQNRDTLAVQLKLSELILAMKNAEDRFAMIEDLPDDELELLHQECRERADSVLSALTARRAGKAGQRPQKTQGNGSKPA